MSEKLATAISYSASAVTTIAGLTINEWVALGGLLIGAATFTVNVWYHRQLLKLHQKQGKHHEKNPLTGLALEVDYRAGIQSLRALAKIYDISESAIRQKAKQCGWQRNGNAIKRAQVNAQFADNAMDNEQAGRLTNQLNQATQDDCRDMQVGLDNARLVLLIAHEVLTAIKQDAQAKHLMMSNARNLKLLSDATYHSVDVIRRIRQLDTPTDNKTA